MIILCAGNIAVRNVGQRCLHTSREGLDVRRSRLGLGAQRHGQQAGIRVLLVLRGQRERARGGSTHGLGNTDMLE